MGTRLYGRLFGMDRTYWSVQFIDRNGGGNTQVKIDSLKPTGSMENPDYFIPGVRTGGVDVGISVDRDKESVIESMIEDIAASEEGRFFIRVYRSQNANPLFFGPMVVEGVIRPIGPTTRVYTFKATCGMSLMKDVEYKDTDGNPFDGYATLKDHIINVIKLMPHHDLMDTAVLWSSVCFWEYRHGSTSVDPLANTRLDHETFTKKDNQGNYQYTKCWDVIINITQAFAAQFRYFEGYWQMLTQSQEVSDYPTFIYGKDGSFLASGVSLNTVPNKIDGQNIKLKWGASQGFFSPFREVKIEYNFEKSISLLQDIKWDHTQDTGSPVTYNVGQLLVEGEETRLAFSAQMQYEIGLYDLTNLDYLNVFPIWELTIAIKNEAGETYEWGMFQAGFFPQLVYGPTQSWVGPGNPGLGDHPPLKIFSREGIEVYPQQDGSMGIYESRLFTIDVNESSPPVYVVSAVEEVIEITITVEFLGLKNRDGSDFIMPSLSFFRWWLVNAELNVVDGKENTTLKRSFVYYARNDVKNTKSVGMTAIFGDGPAGLYSRLQTTANGTDWYDSSSWAKNSVPGPGGKKLLQLAVEDIAGMADTVRKTLRSNLIRPYAASVSSWFNVAAAFDYDGNRYVLRNFSIEANDGEMTVDIIEIASLKSGNPPVSQQRTMFRPVQVPNSGRHEYNATGILRGVAILDEVIKPGDVKDTVIIIETRDRIFNIGDRIILFDEREREEEMIVRLETKLGDAVIGIISHEFELGWYPGQKIKVVEDYDEGNTYTENRRAEIYIEVATAGDYLDLTQDQNGEYIAGLLTKITDNATDAQIRKRVIVFKNGQKLIWDASGAAGIPTKSGFRIDAAMDRLELIYPIQTNDVFEVVINKIETRITG